MDILRISFVYRLSQLVIGGEDSKNKEKEYLVHDVGINVLDVGCGTADLVDGCFEDANYFGVDVEEKYIISNRKKYSAYDNIRFYNYDINDPKAQEELSQRQYDIVMMIGVLHHMDDDACKSCLESIHGLMSEKSRFVSVDPLRWDNMPVLSRILVNLDRGKYVRTERAYRELVETHIPGTRCDVRADLYRFPYRHIIFY